MCCPGSVAVLIGKAEDSSLHFHLFKYHTTTPTYDRHHHTRQVLEATEVLSERRPDFPFPKFM